MKTLHKFLVSLVTAAALFVPAIYAHAAVTFPVNGGTGSTTLSGILKGAGTSPVVTAIGGADYEFPLSFIYPLVRSINSISSAFGTTTSNTWAGTQTFTNSPIFSTLGTGTVNSTSGGGIYSTGTSSLALSGFPANLSGTLGALIGGTNSTFTWWGLSTTSQPISSNILTSNGTNGVYGTATTTASCAGTVSCTSFTILGASPITLTGTGGSATGLSTSSPIAAGNLLEYSSAGVGSAFGVATTTLAGSGVVSISNAPVLIGASPATATITGGSNSQVLAWLSGVPTWVATTTASCSSGITCSFAAGANGFSIANGAITNAMLANSTISGVSLGGTLAALTATNGSLTFSGSYTGTVAQTVGLNVGNANNWTALQSFTNASSSLFSVTNKAYFGGTATTTIDSAGNIVIPSGSSLTNTGVSNGCGTWASGVLGTTGLACNTGTLTSITLGGGLDGASPITTTGTIIAQVGTSTVPTQGGIAYWTGIGTPSTLGTVATGTVSNGTGISVTAGQSVIGSGLTITNTGVTSNVAGTGISVSGATGAVTVTNTSPLSGLSASFPFSFSNPTLSWVGLATTSQPASSNILVSNGTNGIYGAATTTASCAGTVSCTTHTIIGASPITITGSATVPGGASSTIQYNANGAFAGGNVFTDGTKLGVGTSSPSADISVTDIVGSNNLFDIYSNGITNTPFFTINNNSRAMITSFPFIALSQFTIGNGFSNRYDPLFGAGTGNQGNYPFDLQNGNAAVGSSTGMAFSVSNSNSSVGAGIIFKRTGSNSKGEIGIWNHQDTNVGSALFQGILLSDSGNVGISSSSPSARLSVQANANDSVINPNLFMVGSSTATATTTIFNILNTGIVGIGTTSPYAELSLNAPAGLTSYLAIGSSTSQVFSINPSSNATYSLGTSTINQGFAMLAASTTAGTVQSGYNGIVFSVAGLENTVANLFFLIDQWGHQMTGGDAPVLTSCGTSPSFVGAANDNNQTIQVGSVSATGCTTTFAHAWPAAPTCVVTNRSMSVVNAMTYTVSTSAIVISQTGLTSAILDIRCEGTN